MQGEVRPSPVVQQELVVPEREFDVPERELVAPERVPVPKTLERRISSGRLEVPLLSPSERDEVGTTDQRSSEVGVQQPELRCSNRVRKPPERLTF